MNYLILVLLFLFSSCCSSPWKIAALSNPDPNYDLVKVLYPTRDQVYGIKLEFVRYGEEFYSYVNVTNYAFPAYQGDSKSAKIDLCTEGTKRQFIVTRCEGGQRLRLSKEAVNALIYFLKKGVEVTLSCGHFTQSFSPYRFCQAYRTLQKRSARFLSKDRIHIEFY